MPQSTALQYSATPYFFSTNSYDFFVQDDWRVRSNFTFQIGLRYEYIAPYTEANNRLANLDLACSRIDLGHLRNPGAEPCRRVRSPAPAA